MTRRVRARSALATVVAAAAGGCALAAGGAAAAGPPDAVVNCLGKPVPKPAAIVFACGDGNFGARKLRWTGWGEPFAAAVGTGYANDCTPTCAAGHFHDYRIVVVAEAPKPCHGALAYTTFTSAFVGPTPLPRATVADSTYTFRCR
jgi:hypothetical protein